MDKSLTVEICQQLSPVSMSEWKKLFPVLPNSDKVMEQVLMFYQHAVSIHSIVVRHNGKPILLIPLCVSDVNSNGRVRRLVQTLFSKGKIWVKNICGERGVSVGHFLPDSKCIGFDRDVDLSLLSQAKELAFRAFHSLEGKMEIEIVDSVKILGVAVPVGSLESLVAS